MSTGDVEGVRLQKEELAYARNSVSRCTTKTREYSVDVLLARETGSNVESVEMRFKGIETMNRRLTLSSSNLEKSCCSFLLVRK